MALIAKLVFLFAGHALCDYPLQGDFLARGKNKWSPIPGIPWYHCMAAHCMIHAAMVYLITGSMLLCGLEFAIHFATDYAKCAGWFGQPAKAFNIDQAVHFACKIAWGIL